MRVLELFTRQVVTTRRDDSLVTAIEKMRDEHVGALVVVDERKGNGTKTKKPIGMLTDRDIVVGVLAKDTAHLRTLDVGDVMSEAPLITATGDEDLVDVLHRMRSFGVRRVPVVDDDGMLEGVLAFDDVIVGLSEELGEAAALVSRQRMQEPARRP
jgi:CBS domain-containing protein